MITVSLTRWLVPAALAAGLGLAALAPVSARAADHRVEDDLVRVVVDVADVIFRGGHPYYRHGGYGYGDRLVVVHDRHGRPAYYRHVPRAYGYRDYHDGRRSGPPYGQAHGYWKQHRVADAGRRVVCDRYGRCIARHDDPRYDRRYYSYHDGHDGYRHDHDRYERDRYDRYGRDRYGWRHDDD